MDGSDAVMIEGKAIEVQLVDGVEVAGEQYTYSDSAGTWVQIEPISDFAGAIVDIVLVGTTDPVFPPPAEPVITYGPLMDGSDAVMIEGKAIEVQLVDGVEVAGEQYTYSDSAGTWVQIEPISDFAGATVADIVLVGTTVYSHLSRAGHNLWSFNGWQRCCND